MQGQRSTLQSLTDTFEFDHGSSPNDSSVDQPHYWNNILNPDDAQNLPDYLPSPTGSNALYLSSVSHDGGSLPNWNHDGSSSGDHIRQQCGHESGKMEHRWMDSLASCAGPSLRSEERLELNNHRSRESVDINLNSDQVESRPWFPNSTSSNIPQNQNFNVGFAGNGGQVAESHPYKPCGSENEQISSASGAGDPCATTSATMIDYLADAGNGRPSGSLDGRNLSCKRKALEGVSGQTSLSASASFFQRAENSVWHPVSASHGAGSSLSISGNPEEPISSANFHEELMNQRFGSARRGVSASDCHPAAFYVADNSQRNFRMRINPALHDSTEPSNLCASASNASSRISHVRSSHQSSSGVLPFTHNVETRPAATTATGTSSAQPSQHPPYPQNVHPYAFHRPHSLRAGSSSNSSVVSGDRPSVLHDEAYPSSLPRSISENPVFVPATELRQLTQDRTNWNSLNGNVSAAANLASSSRINSNSTGVHSTPALTWVPHHTPPRYTRRLSEIIRRSLFPTSSSEPGGQSSNLPPIGLGASQGMAPPSVFSQRGGHQHSHLRSALRMDRHGDAVMGVPLSLQSLAGAPEGRSRLASEIRNVLDLVRRGESLRFEDVVILDPSDFYGVADLHDRHRDLRLDVDNMSYEELLALEERIGNVNTGLSEETVFKFLKRSNFLQVAAEAPQEVEPCCICREEYVEGEELGTLECGHDFHTLCIKQWLMVKNLCPICKKTGLIT